MAGVQPDAATGMPQRPSSTHSLSVATSRIRLAGWLLVTTASTLPATLWQSLARLAQAC